MIEIIKVIENKNIEYINNNGFDDIDENTDIEEVKEIIKNNVNNLILKSIEENDFFVDNNDKGTFKYSLDNINWKILDLNDNKDLIHYIKNYNYDLFIDEYLQDNYTIQDIHLFYKLGDKSFSMELLLYWIYNNIISNFDDYKVIDYIEIGHDNKRIIYGDTYLDENKNDENKWNLLNDKYDNLLKRSNSLLKNINQLDLNYTSLLFKIRSLKNKIQSRKINKYKEKQKKFDENLKILEKDFYDIYNSNLIICKYNSCKNKCGNDISYCINHMPKFCEKCNYICDPNNKVDRLHYNKKYNIINYCNNCSQEVYFDDYCKNYKLEDIFYIIDENDKFYKTKKALSKKTYFDIEKDAEILHEIDKPSDLQEKEILDFYGYDTKEYNDFTKHKLYNRIIRSSELLSELGNNLINLKIKPSFYSYISKIQFISFKKILYKLLNIDIIDNMLKNIF